LYKYFGAGLRERRAPQILLSSRKTISALAGPSRPGTTSRTTRPSAETRRRPHVLRPRRHDAGYTPAEHGCLSKRLRAGQNALWCPGGRASEARPAVVHVKRVTEEPRRQIAGGKVTGKA